MARYNELLFLTHTALRKLKQQPTNTFEKCKQLFIHTMTDSPLITTSV
jgi:hypothetical protein